MNKKWAGFSDQDDEQESNAIFDYPGQLSESQRQTALAQVTGGGMIKFNRLQLSKKGLLAPDDVTVAELEEVGGFLRGLDETIQLMFGDMANYFPEQRHKYERLSEITGKSVKTLRNFAYVANAVQMSNRFDNLKFSHYREVTTLDYKQQKEVLSYASQEDLSVSQMLSYMRKRGYIVPPQIGNSYALADELSRIGTTQLKWASKLPKEDRVIAAQFYRSLADKIEKME